MDSRGWLWMANENSGDCPHVGWYDGSNWNGYLTSDKTFDVASDSKGDVYFSTSSREILRYHYGSWFTQGSVFLSSSLIDPIFCDQKNVLWLGKASSYFAILKYDGKSWTEYNSLKSNFPPSPVSCLQDLGDNLWIGTSTHGLVKMTDTVFTIFNPSNSILPSSKVSALATLKDTLFIFCGNKLLSYKTSFAVFSKFPGEIKVSEMAVDGYGNFWFTSDLGLVKYNRLSWQIYNSKNSPIGDAELTSLVIDKSNNIWIGTKDHGLIRFNETKSSFISDHKATLEVRCYPNPLADKLILNYTLPSSCNVNIDIADISGKKIVSRDLGLSYPGQNNRMVSLPDLDAGIYVLSIITPFGKEVIKLKK
jgi:ligand-binding sensor domain-containing protein